MRRFPSRLFVGLVLLCVVVLAGGCSQAESALGLDDPSFAVTPGAAGQEQACVWTAPGTPAPAGLAGPVHKIGESVALGDLRVTVQRVYCVAAALPDQPAPDWQYLVVEYAVENQGATPRTVSSTFQARLVDSARHEYESDVVGSQRAGVPINGVIDPHNRRVGRVGFQVPLNAGGLVFVFDSHPFGDEGQAYVAIH